jgi:hypothetical protein
MDEVFSAVLYATSSAAASGSSNGRSMFSARATCAVSRANALINSRADGRSNNPPFFTRNKAVSGLIAALTTSFPHIRDFASSTTWTLKPANRNASSIGPRT